MEMHLAPMGQHTATTAVFLIRRIPPALALGNIARTLASWLCGVTCVTEGQ
jgi:hypothetical protein